MKYQNKKSGKVLEFVKEENGFYFLTDGQQEQKFSTSTFKRWWKKVEEPKEDREVASDGTPFTEVMKEIVAGAEKKAEEAQTATVESILNDMIQSGKKVFISDAMKAIADAGLQTDVKFVTDFLMNGGVVEEKKEKKQKKEKKEVNKQEKTENIDEKITTLFESVNFENVNLERSEKYPNWVDIKIDGKNRIGLAFGAKRVRIRTKVEYVPDGIEYNEVKGNYTASVFVTYEDDYADVIINTIKKGKEVV